MTARRFESPPRSAKGNPNTDWNEHAIRCGVVLLVFHHYDDQAGGYSVNRALKDSKGMLQAFERALADHNALYGDAPKLELAFGKTEVSLPAKCHTGTAERLHVRNL
ncbi:hypothetical protein [Pseudomonas sp. MAG733B]|uniref:hypothetical protein n=1 Tax=Pseudomonas sp. MAG733B TaxID=3122079 RepID=UPI0030D34D0C